MTTYTSALGVKTLSPKAQVLRGQWEQEDAATLSKFTPRELMAINALAEVLSEL